MDFDACFFKQKLNQFKVCKNCEIIDDVGVCADNRARVVNWMMWGGCADNNARVVNWKDDVCVCVCRR